MSESSENKEGTEPGTGAGETTTPATDVEGHNAEEYDAEGVICGVYDRQPGF